MTIGYITNIIEDGDYMDYGELIKIVENKRNEMRRKYMKSIIFKKKYLEYLNKYDNLLIDLYTKYEKYLTIKDN